MYTTEIYNTEEEWLQHRGLGGSSASAILDSNPYMTKIELWSAILDQKDRTEQLIEKNKKSKKNEVLEYGHKCEPIIRKLVSINLSKEYKVVSPKKYQMYRRKDKPYLTATIDSLLIRKTDGLKGIHEIKTRVCKNQQEYNEWTIEKKIPQNYYIQCLHYLVVMKDCDYVILTPKLVLNKRTHDNKWIIDTETIVYGLIIWRKDVEKELEYLEKKETEFWEQNILKREIPKIKIKL